MKINSVLVFFSGNYRVLPFQYQKETFLRFVIILEIKKSIILNKAIMKNMKHFLDFINKQ